MIVEVLAVGVLVAFSSAVVVCGFISGGLLGVLFAVMFVLVLNVITYLTAKYTL